MTDTNDFPDVDTSVEPPQFYPKPEADPMLNVGFTASGVPIAFAGDPQNETAYVGAAGRNPAPPVPRVPKVGDRVVGLYPSGAYVEGKATAVASDQWGAISMVRIGADTWLRLIGWVEPDSPAERGEG